ncbi:MAG: Ldh family oxidoreductase [Reyranellaceae bacterium]
MTSKFVPFDELVAILAEILVSNGLSPANAPIVARTIAAAERDRSKSHGFSRLPGYIGSLTSGWVNGASVPRVEEATQAIVEVDADNGYAQVALEAARALLAKKASENGVAVLSTRNSQHFAALWPDLEGFSLDGFIGLTMINSRSRMTAWGGKSKVLGTNAMAFSVPRKDALPVVWDQASSIMSQGDVLIAANRGGTVPLGIGVDAAGRPTQNPKDILGGGSLLPFGGPKGSSIAFMVEVLAAAFTGSKFGIEDESGAFSGAASSRGGQFMMLIDPSRIDSNRYFDRVETLIEAILASGADRLPADKRYKARAVSLQRGVEITADEQALLKSCGARL